MEYLGGKLKKKDGAVKLSDLFGEVIATGAERTCVRNLKNPSTCFKISKKNHSKETVREIEYFKYLNRKGISSPFIPKFINEFKTDTEIVIEQELISDHPDQGIFAYRVEEFVGNADENQLAQLEEFFRQLLRELKDKNIIISDLHAGNMMLYCNKEGLLKRLIVVDGFGCPEAIPLAKYFPFFGKRKIDRQWAKFRNTFLATLMRRRQPPYSINF